MFYFIQWLRARKAAFWVSVGLPLGGGIAAGTAVGVGYLAIPLLAGFPPLAAALLAGGIVLGGGLATSASLLALDVAFCQLFGNVQVGQRVALGMFFLGALLTALAGIFYPLVSASMPALLLGASIAPLGSVLGIAVLGMGLTVVGALVLAFNGEAVLMGRTLWRFSQKEKTSTYMAYKYYFEEEYTQREPTPKSAPKMPAKKAAKEASDEKSNRESSAASRRKAPPKKPSIPPASKPFYPSYTPQPSTNTQWRARWISDNDPRLCEIRNEATRQQALNDIATVKRACDGMWQRLSALGHPSDIMVNGIAVVEVEATSLTMQDLLAGRAELASYSARYQQV